MPVASGCSQVGAGDSAVLVVSPITGEDLEAVGEFLQTHLNHRVSAKSWIAALHVPWEIDSPNFGFKLTDPEDRLAGVLLAFYSERRVRDSVERFCNLGAWCVLDGYRRHSFRMLRAALAQSGYTFTDLSPSGAVVPLNERLGFTRLPSGVRVVPCSPIPSPRTTVVSDPRRLEQLLEGRDRQIFLDHRGAPAAHHLLLRRAGHDCYVIYRRDRRRNIPAFASLLYASDPSLPRSELVALGNHVLRHHRALALLVDEQAVGKFPFSRRITGRPKMFKSSTVAARDVDNLYSELTCVAW